MSQLCAENVEFKTVMNPGEGQMIKSLKRSWSSSLFMLWDSWLYDLTWGWIRYIYVYILTRKVCLESVNMNHWNFLFQAPIFLVNWQTLWIAAQCWFPPCIDVIFSVRIFYFHFHYSIWLGQESLRLWEKKEWKLNLNLVYWLKDITDIILKILTQIDIIYMQTMVLIFVVIITFLTLLGENTQLPGCWSR